MGFFLLNSGVLYETVNHDSSAINLNSNFDTPYFGNEETLGISFINEYGSEQLVFSDLLRSLNLLANLDREKFDQRLIQNNNTIDKGYIYLGEYNIKTNTISIFNTSGIVTGHNYQKFNYYENNMIYSSDNCNIYYL